MKKQMIAVSVLTFTILVSSCNKKAEESPNEEKVSAIMLDNAAVSSDKNEISKNLDTPRKFIQTADINFKVKNVHQSTQNIENTVKKLGGFVILSDLQSNAYDTNETKISNDSILKTTKYAVTNAIQVRVPNYNLDAFINSLSKEIQFLEHRTIKADEAQFALLAERLAQKRNHEKTNRLVKATDAKGKKLNDIQNSEEAIEQSKQQTDESYVNQLKLNDQIDFSTVTLAIHQNDQYYYEKVVNNENIADFRPHLGILIWDSIKQGWYILENLLLIFIRIWPLVILGVLGFMWYRVKKVKV